MMDWDDSLFCRDCGSYFLHGDGVAPSHCPACGGDGSAPLHGSIGPSDGDLEGGYVIRPAWRDGTVAPMVSLYAPGDVFVSEFSVNTDALELAVRRAVVQEPARVFYVADNGNVAELDPDAWEVVQAWAGPKAQATARGAA